MHTNSLEYTHFQQKISTEKHTSTLHSLPQANTSILMLTLSLGVDFSQHST